MTQLFPFSKANTIGWSPGQKITSTQINTIDANAAQAADGTIWSDVALLKSIAKTTVVGGGSVIFWEGFSKRWINAYASSGNPAALFAYGAGDWLAMSITAGSNWNGTSAGASNGVGSVILGGGGGSATASKIRQSADGGATWNARNTNASGTESVTCAIWHPGASKFVIGMSSNSSTNIETSPDGITWTAQTALVGPRGVFASNGSAVVCIFNASSTQFCVSSSDAVTWTTRTLPATTTWNALAYNARSGKFMAIAPSAIATSADGATWSASGLTAPFNNATWSLTALNRAWVAIGSTTGPINQIAVSIDDGVSWSPVCSLSAAGTLIASGDNQVAAVISNAVYLSTRGGS